MPVLTLSITGLTKLSTGQIDKLLSDEGSRQLGFEHLLRNSKWPRGLPKINTPEGWLRSVLPKTAEAPELYKFIHIKEHYASATNGHMLVRAYSGRPDGTYTMDFHPTGGEVHPTITGDLVINSDKNGVTTAVKVGELVNRVALGRYGCQLMLQTPDGSCVFDARLVLLALAGQAPLEMRYGNHRLWGRNAFGGEFMVMGGLRNDHSKTIPLGHSAGCACSSVTVQSTSRRMVSS